MERMDAKKIQYVSGDENQPVNLACVPSISEMLMQQAHRIRCQMRRDRLKSHHPRTVRSGLDYLIIRPLPVPAFSRAELV